MSVTTAPATDASPRPMVRSNGRSRASIAVWGPPILVFAVIVAGWYALAASFAARSLKFVLPYPHEIFLVSFAPELSEKYAGKTVVPDAITQDLLAGLYLSTTVALIGLLIAMLIGIIWAVLMSQAKWVERSLFPYAVILQCVPILALVPLIGISIGYDIESRILVCVLISLFPMVSNTLFGLQSVERSQRELFKLQRASRWTVLTKLQFPSAMPAIFAGMRISAGLAVVGSIVGDFFFRRGQPGLGILINVYASRLQAEALFATILTAALLGVAIFLVFGLFTKLAVGRWYEPAS